METVESVKFTAAEGNPSDEDSWVKLKPLVRRYWPFLIITWSVHLGMGLCASLTGVTLPYLALNAGETLARVSFFYTARSVTVCFVSMAVGLATKRLKSSRSKLLLLLIGNLLNATSALVMPFAKSLAVLFLAQILFGVGLGSLDTVDNMLVIYTFGPVLSRSFSHSLHFCIAIGAFLAPLLARPFLIQMGDVGAEGDVCGASGGSLNVTSNSTLVNLEPLKWPYVITGCLHSLWIIGYVVLLATNFQLIKYSTPQIYLGADKRAQSEPRRMSRRRQTFVVALFVLFYVLHVGQENVFWSHLYSFGVCAQNLRMSPSDASLLSTIFFVGFLISRGFGIVVARVMRPSRILIVQLIGCLISTVLLAALSGASPLVAYIGSGLYGFCIAMVFPTGITWLASKMDVTGSLSSCWIVGGYVGLSTYPLAAGQLFMTTAGAISIMYLATFTSAACIVIVAVMFFIAR